MKWGARQNQWPALGPSDSHGWQKLAISPW